MSKRKVYKCPLCKKKYVEIGGLHQHIELEHPEYLTNGVTPSQLLFNHRNKYPLDQPTGKCIMDRRPTKWNESTGRYERLCSERCRIAYREQFKKRMMKTHGKTTLLNDPEHQKKMLANRKISGVYEWSDGVHKFEYVGSYEKDFLEFLDHVVGWTNPGSIHAPAPQVIYYEYNGEKSFYLPDFYLESIGPSGNGLIVEIKSKDNKHYRLRDIDIEKAKDEAIIKTGLDYIKIYDKDYTEFLKLLSETKKTNM